MMDRFKMFMMGVLTFFLGFQIKQVKEETFISQMKYTNGHLDLDLDGTSVDQKVYRSMIGSLLYLCASRPDIRLSVCMCVRFQDAPKDCHLRAVKRIMRHLVLISNLGLWYPKGSRFELIENSDAKVEGCFLTFLCCIG
jgi:hypothetical protein